MADSVSVLNLGPGACTARGGCGLAAGLPFAGAGFLSAAGFFAEGFLAAGFLGAGFFLAGGCLAGTVEELSCATAGGTANARPQTARTSALRLRAIPIDVMANRADPFSRKR